MDNKYVFYYYSGKPRVKNQLCTITYHNKDFKDVLNDICKSKIRFKNAWIILSDPIDRTAIFTCTNHGEKRIHMEPFESTNKRHDVENISI
jgi:hypothetical protein